MTDPQNAGPNATDFTSDPEFFTLSDAEQHAVLLHDPDYAQHARRRGEPS